MPSRVLIVDDHALLRAAIRSMLTSGGDLVVVGEAGDGEEALALCRRLRPDLVLMDVSMPGVDGIEATRAIKGEFPKTGVLMLTAHTDHELLLEAVRAAGYVLKEERGTGRTGRRRPANPGRGVARRPGARHAAGEEPGRAGQLR